MICGSIVYREGGLSMVVILYSSSVHLSPTLHLASNGFPCFCANLDLSNNYHITCILLY